MAMDGRMLELTFQSTLSVRRATNRMAVSRLSQPISIHALREESDTELSRCNSLMPYFNPRSP